MMSRQPRLRQTRVNQDVQVQQDPAPAQTTAPDENATAGYAHAGPV